MIYEATYKHWNGSHTGIWHRRWTITQTTLKAILQTRGFKPIIMGCWMICLAVIALLFIGGQLLVEDSIVYRWFSFVGSEAKTNQNSLVSMLVRALKDNPEVTVRAAYAIIFYYFTWILSPIAAILSAFAIPHLVTRDLASNAITVYSSKAVSRLDYLLGKFGAIMGVFVLSWLAPTIVAWFMGNLLAPDWHFFWHSRLALLNSVAYIGTNMILLSFMVLGVSALSGKEKSTIGLWLAWYVIGIAFVAAARETKPWLKYFSFKYNLEQISLALFDLRLEGERLMESLPVMEIIIRNMDRRYGQEWYKPELAGAMIALTVMCLIAFILLGRKVRPE